MPLATFTFLFYLILSNCLIAIQPAFIPRNKIKAAGVTTGTDNKVKLPKINGPSVDLVEKFDEFQVTGPFRTSKSTAPLPVLRNSWSTNSLSSTTGSSSKYSPLARLALSNSQKEAAVAIKGDEVNELVIEDIEYTEEFDNDMDIFVDDGELVQEVNNKNNRFVFNEDYYVVGEKVKKNLKEKNTIYKL